MEDGESNGVVRFFLNSFLILCAEIPLLCRTSVNFANLATGLNLRVVIDDHSSHLIKIDGSSRQTQRNIRVLKKFTPYSILIPPRLYI